MNKRKGSGISFYLILVVVILISSFYMSKLRNPTAPALSQLEADIRAGKISSVVLNGNELQLNFRAAQGQAAKTYVKSINSFMIQDFYKLLSEMQRAGKLESFDYQQPTDFAGIFNGLLLFLMLGGMLFFMYFSFTRQGGDGKTALNFGRNRAKVNDPSKNKVNFGDVAGADEEKDELKEIVDFLKNPDKYAKLGAKIPRGILLVGAPGTGKTLLAKAVAGEAGVPFFSISGSDFVEMFVGVGASRVRDLFEDAKKQTPCIVFIDEIDAVGRHRGAGLGGGHDEREQTLNQLLVEMDGFGPNEGVIIMAATNRPDILDPALLRPGRFDRRIQVMRPDLRGRYAILQVHARNKPLEQAVDLNEIAKITPGFTGADLANLLNEAALLAARNNASVISYQDISEAVFKITIGPEKKSRIITDKERHLTASHESGHAIVLRQVSATDRVERVTIIPAGGAGGYTAFKPDEDSYFKTRQDLLAAIMVALGGRAAEELTQADISTGAADDLQRCNQIARAMISKYGMSKTLGNFVLAEDDEVFLGRDYGHSRSYSESISATVDDEVRKILDQAYNEALTVLRDNHVLLEELTKLLLEKEKIEGLEFERLYEQYAVNYKAPIGKNTTYISDLGTEKPAEDEAEYNPEKPSAEAEAEA